MSREMNFRRNRDPLSASIDAFTKKVEAEIAEDRKWSRDIRDRLTSQHAQFIEIDYHEMFRQLFDETESDARIAQAKSSVDMIENRFSMEEAMKKLEQDILTDLANKLMEKQIQLKNIESLLK